MRYILNVRFWLPLAIAGMLLAACSTASAQVPRFGNGYENLSRRTTGGKVRTGDTLDIKMAIHLPWGFNGGAAGQVVMARFYDNIPTHTVMLAGSTDSIRILTNEDLTFARYTPAVGDDAAQYIATPPPGEFQIRLNLGNSPGVPANHNITNTTGAQNINLTSTWPYGDRPKWWTGHIFSTSFRVRVTGSSGDTIRLTGGRFVFRRTSGGADSVISGVPYRILIGSNDSLCQSGIGVNFAGEFGGTFGSGTTLNRSGGPSVLVPDYGYVSNISRSQPLNDGFYGIVNNISPLSSTNRNARRQPNCTSPSVIPVADSCVNRMHGGHWEIEGDHTGSTSRWGNHPPAAGAPAGYMLLVNADYITSDAYEQTINNLCPNTYYEFSCWLRNVCRTCGADNNLTSTAQPGVRPTLTFAVDDIDRYSTGELDTTGWIKRSFLFQTGATQSSARFTIRNNAQGGGGNDWALDDISINSCIPQSNFNYQPLMGCDNGTLVSLADTVRFRYNNTYTWYKWERSTDGGITWGAPPVPTQGQATPTWVNGAWQFVTHYPSFLAYAADSGHRYRVVVATTEANLNSANCSFAGLNSVLLQLIDCSGIVDARITAFNARLDTRQLAHLNWIIATEVNMVSYEVERSENGVQYTKIGEVLARNNPALPEYFFTDPLPVTRTAYYRLKMVNNSGLYTYSNVVQLNARGVFAVNRLLNPVGNKVVADVELPEDGTVVLQLYGTQGALLLQQAFRMFKGTNSLQCSGLDALAPGLYIARFRFGATWIQRKIIRR